jgi:hypothetical protein
VHQLFHSLGRTVSTSHAGILAAAGQTNETVRESTRVAVHRKLGIATAQDDSAAVIPTEKKEGSCEREEFEPTPIETDSRSLLGVTHRPHAVAHSSHNPPPQNLQLNKVLQEPQTTSPQSSH